MSKTKSGHDRLPGGIVTGDGGAVPGRFKLGNLISNLSRRSRLLLLAVLSIAVIGAATYAVVLSNRPTLDEQRAVTASSQEAKGLDPISKEYALTRLNTAVNYAFDDKSTEARAIYDDVTGRKNGLEPIDQKAYKNRIDQICSGAVKAVQD